MTDTRILLVTRNYPPQVGGMERYSHDLYHNLSSVTPVDLLKNSHGKLFLPFFFLHCLVFIGLYGRRYTHIHFCDAVLAPLVVFTRVVTSAHTSITVHALDLIYDNWLYQRAIPACLARAGKLVAVSRYTLEQCVSREVSRKRCYLIPNGLDYSSLAWTSHHAR